MLSEGIEVNLSRRGFEWMTLQMRTCWPRDLANRFNRLLKSIFFGDKQLTG